MKLKGYQIKVLDLLKDYLSSLAAAKNEYDELMELKPHLAKHYNFPREAWDKIISNRTYHPRTNGLQQPLPDIYLKVPTGGGKTLLACHSIDLIHKMYLNKQSGLVLWIVPTNQIYRQTIKALKDREHPYRNALDISSGGKTLIKEKTEQFTQSDIENNLVVLMLMLPSANRLFKDTLRMFRDSGAFTDFYPDEDDAAAQKELKEKFPNLECYTSENEILGLQLKTSLGNTLKLLQPLIVIDEGHKAYSEQARKTIEDFNPPFILELSATPPDGTNKLVGISGKELHAEEMIKLDIHLINKTSTDWKDIMIASKAKREELERIAITHKNNTGEYIRPICLIQVENTGAAQINKDTIHSEHVKEYLIKQCNIPENQIAIKSSDKDELVEVTDIFAEDCEIRYIITKYALQEGWDCSFAYILTILTNPKSKTPITQLVGRILRQPYAHKTKVKALDESYVFTYKENASAIVNEIKTSLGKEGLEDIAGRMVSEPENGGGEAKDRFTNYRSQFKMFEGKIYLPKFVVQEKHGWRDVNFDVDIMSRIPWKEISIDEIGNRTLNTNKQTAEATKKSKKKKKESEDWVSGKIDVDIEGGLKIDEVFLARQLNEIVPNPWISFELGERALKILARTYSKEEITDNFIFIIEELKKILEAERDRLAEDVFRKMLETKKLFFFLLKEEGHALIPSRIRVNGKMQLNRTSDNKAVQKSLFDEVVEEEFDTLEKEVAVYLDEQEKLLWWYRNISRQNYHIQGWKEHKIFPDFIATKKDKKKKDYYETVYVLETKGIHLKGNADTTYKKNVFKLCREIGVKEPWVKLFDEFPDHDFEFQVIYGDEWEDSINQIMQ